MLANGPGKGNEEALRLFYQAIERDPDFSAAYAAAADCFARRKVFGWVIDALVATVERRHGGETAIKQCCSKRPSCRR